MDIELKNKWVAALRSGEYPQTRGVLKDCEGGHCCLGVLADLIPEQQWDNTSTEKYGYHRSIFHYGGSFYTTTVELPQVIFIDLGLAETITVEDRYVKGLEENRPIYDYLMDLNDGAGWTFDQIADWIEENL